MSAKRKLFFFDLDGTLLNDKKEITPDTYKALLAWHEAGHKIAISSGRPMRSILDVIRQHKLDALGAYAVAFNGAQIRDVSSGEDIIKKKLSMDDVEFLSRTAGELELYIHCYNDDTILTPREGEELAFYTRVVKLPHKLLQDFPKGIDSPPYKMLCIDLAASEKEELFTKRVAESRDGRISCIRSNPWYLEIFPADAGKGAAVGELAAALGIDIADTYAAGDAPNDASMLAAAGCGIAMCNGETAAKEAADIVTALDNNHDGLAEYLLRFI